MDDLRVVSLNMKRRLDLWSDRRGLDGVMRKFDYCFHSPPGSDYPPILNGHLITEPFTDFDIAGAGGALTVRAFGQGHGRIRSLGYRFGPVAYSPDADALDEEAFAALAGVECWIVDALRRQAAPLPCVALGFGPGMVVEGMLFVESNNGRKRDGE